MKTYVIEREIPGASQLTHEELRVITSTSNDVVESLGKPYRWLHSYVAGDAHYAAAPPGLDRTTESAPRWLLAFLA